MNKIIAKMNQLYIVLPFIILISACNTLNKKEENISNNPQELFKHANKDMKEANYKDAIVQYEQIEREFPSSTYAAESNINRAYTHYLKADFDEALFAIEDFIAQYPTHPSVSYMYYLRALCYYDEITDVDKDQQITVKALSALDEVISRFGNSTYANDAALKRDLAFNQLASKEMDIGLFYLKQKNIIAAMKRFKNVIDKYDTSIFTPESLFRMTEIYYSLGVKDQATKYALVLEHNFKDSLWARKAKILLMQHKFDAQTSLIKRILKQIW